MVAIINNSTSIHRAIAYNEKKVKKGSAGLILAGNYPVDLDKISDDMKIKRFTKRRELNRNVNHNTLHISLNFSPLQHYSTEKLIAIAACYMEKIGFAKQPYLVYQHFDAGHPHLHIITINIEESGKSIDLHKIVLYKSLPAIREIEPLFGLFKTYKQSENHKPDLSSAVGKIQYGKMESKKAMTRVLSFILKRYNYTNLSELNAVLGQYNLMADRGKENSKIFLSGGLLYKILTSQGKPVGMPIKASLLDGRPTLKFLETHFKINAAQNTAQKKRVKNIIMLVQQRQPNLSQDIFIKMLQRQGITAIEQKSASGTDEIIYIDQKTRCVFSDKNLGLSYNITTLKNNISTDAIGDKKQLAGKNYLHKL